MSETIVLELDADLTHVSRIGVVAAGSWQRLITVEQAVSSGLPVVCVIPGEWVALHTADLPPFPDAKLVKVLPGLMEEMVGVSVLDQHFALVGGSGAQKQVAVISNAVLETALTTLRDLGLVVDRIVPDYLLLECPSEVGHAVTFAGRVLMRGSDGFAASAEATQAELMLGGEHAIALDEDGWRTLLARAALLSDTLMQGSFAPRGSVLAGFVWFRRAGLLTAASLLLWVGMTLMQASDNEARAEAYYAKAEALFRQALPETLRIVNMEAQMRRALQGVRQQGGSEFFALSSLVFSAVQQTEQTMLESMRFDQEDGELVLSVSFASFAEGEAFKEGLQQAGALVAEGSSRQEGTRVFSELTLRRAG